MKYFEVMYALIAVSSQKILRPIKFMIVITHAAEWVQPPVENWVAGSGL